MGKRRHYKQAILRMLQKSSRPLDVEKIRTGCNIGNWNTALKHCLELQLDAKIQGVKSSKSWIFWMPDEKNQKHPIPDGRFRIQKYPTPGGGFLRDERP